MKVFAMNDCDWVAAETLEAAKALYLKDYWGGSNDEGAFDDPRELSDDEMARLQFVDTDDDEKPTGRRSFREQLDKLIAAGQTFPCFFASTEY